MKYKWSVDTTDFKSRPSILDEDGNYLTSEPALSGAYRLVEAHNKSCEKIINNCSEEALLKRINTVKYLYVVGDQNDADYVTKLKPIEQSDLDRFMPLIQAIKDFKFYSGVSKSGMSFTHQHNWPRNEYCPREDLGEKPVEEIYGHIDPELIEEFEETYIPWDIHSVESIEVLEITKRRNLLK